MARVQVTFAGSPSLLSEQWEDLQASITNLMPLRNLHWKSLARPSIRTIQELHVNLVAWDAVNPSSHVASPLLDQPLLNIYFAVCDDIDSYKNSVRKQIQEWHSSATRRKDQEWLLLAIRPDTQAVGKRLFHIKGSVLDKMKADFNTDKHDRCVQLVWTPGVNDALAWAEFTSKLKEGIVSSFDSRVLLREEEVRKLENQRQTPNWNFCTFCISKETLASSFEGMNLLEDAQIQFDELEASYFQVVKERDQPPLHIFGGHFPKDDSMPLLSLSKKPYRDLIMSNSITVFDFRIYLLGRQCSLLARHGDILAAAQKASRFVYAFGRSMKTSEHLFGLHYIESWTYSAALNIVDQCEEWASSAGLEPAALSRLSGIMGELLELARNQLDKIGIASGHLPDSTPFSMATASPLPNSRTTLPAKPTVITQRNILAAIDDREMFDKLYIMITNRSIECYTVGKRKRFVLKMHRSLTALEQHRSKDGFTRSSVPSFSHDLNIWDHPIFFIRSVDSLANRVPGDASSLAITIVNRLSCNINIDALSIRLFNKVRPESVNYVAGPLPLASGDNRVQACCSSAVPGLFLVESLEIRMDQLFYRHSFSRGNTSTSRTSRPLTVEIPAPSTVREFHMENSISEALPVIVNVQDFYRDHRLFSRFTISSDGQQCTQILETKLVSKSNNIRIHGTRTAAVRNEWVMPHRPVHFLFRIEPSGVLHFDNPENLQFIIRYRTLVEGNLDKSLVSPAKRTWTEPLLNDGDGPAEESKLPMQTTEDIADVLRRAPSPLSAAQQPKELILPLDLPYLNIINAVKLVLPPNTSIYAGQPVPCTLLVSTSYQFRWGTHDRHPGCRMKYEVLGSDMNSWLISGRSRDEYNAEDGMTLRVELTLIALRQGLLALPTVSVNPMPELNGSGSVPPSETHQEHAAVRVKILPTSAHTTYMLTLPSQETYVVDSEADS